MAHLSIQVHLLDNKIISKRLLIVNRRLSRHIRDLSTMFLSLISAGVRTRLSAPSHTVRITQSQVGQTLALKALLRNPSTPVMQPRRIQGLRMMPRPSKVVVTACCSCLGSAACNLAGQGPIQRMRKWQGPFRVACGLRSAHCCRTSGCTTSRCTTATLAAFVRDFSLHLDTCGFPVTCFLPVWHGELCLPQKRSASRFRMAKSLHASTCWGVQGGIQTCACNPEDTVCGRSSVAIEEPMARTRTEISEGGFSSCKG